MDTVPRLLKELLETDDWRHFVTRLGKEVTHDRVEEFVLAQPLDGLGASVDLVGRLIGTDDPDLLRLWRNARKGKPGRPRKGEEKASDSDRISRDGADAQADRLARVAPDEYEAVRRQEKTINAAAIAAGIRPHRISVRIDQPASAARTLRKHMSTEQIAELIRLLHEAPR